MGRCGLALDPRNSTPSVGPWPARDQPRHVIFNTCGMAARMRQVHATLITLLILVASGATAHPKSEAWPDTATRGAWEPTLSQLRERVSPLSLHVHWPRHCRAGARKTKRKPSSRGPRLAAMQPLIVIRPLCAALAWSRRWGHRIAEAKQKPTSAPHLLRRARVPSERTRRPMAPPLLSRQCRACAERSAKKCARPPGTSRPNAQAWWSMLARRAKRATGVCGR